MGFDSLFERLVVATEKIAAALQQEKAAAEVEAAKPRGRKAKDPQPEAAPTVAEVKAEVVAEAAKASTTKSFLDDEDEAAAPAVPELTEAEHRAEIRKQMLALQKALDPDRALSILVKHGKAETLKALKPENFQALYAAIAEAMPKAAT